MPALLLQRDNGDHIVGIWPAFIGIAALFILGGLLLRWICLRRARKDFRPLYNSTVPTPAPNQPQVALSHTYPPTYPPAHTVPSSSANSPFLAPAAPPSPALHPELASPGYSRFLPDGHSAQKPEDARTKAEGTGRRTPAVLTLEQRSLSAAGGGAAGAPRAGLPPPPYSPSVRGIGSDIRGT